MLVVRLKLAELVTLSENRRFFSFSVVSRWRADVVWCAFMKGERMKGAAVKLTHNARSASVLQEKSEIGRGRREAIFCLLSGV